MKYRFSGAKLKKARASKGWTKEDVARKLRKFDKKINRGYVWHWENGVQPSLEKFFFILMVFNKKWDYFLGDR